MSVRAPLLLLCVVTACSEVPPDAAGLVPLPPLTSAPLVDTRTLAAAHARSVEGDRSPADVAELSRYLAEGWGEVRTGTGARAAVHTLDGAPPPAPSADARLLVRFVHLADMQLTDDESPGRVVALDALDATSAAYRPQEAWGCRVLEATVRTIAALHRERPIELVVSGGDNIDNAQANELAWFQAITGGAPRVECDSGADDDPIAGPDNDPKDPFVPVGLPMRWLWVTGNHDILAQGNFPVTAERIAEHVGTAAPLGTRDWSRPGAPTTTGPVPADPARAPLDRASLIAAVAADGDGHGLAELAARGEARAFYAADVASGALRIIAVDTGAETGSASGLIRRADLESRVRPLLDAALRDGVAVIVTSHHASGSLTDGGGFAGVRQDDAVLADAWRAFLGGYPHVVMHLAAHSHRARTRVIRPEGGHAYFEVQTASLADWPAQARLFEVWSEPGGTRVRALPFDYADEGDPLAAEARRRAAVDFTSGWSGITTEESGLIELWIPAR